MTQPICERCPTPHAMCPGCIECGERRAAERIAKLEAALREIREVVNGTVPAFGEIIDDIARCALSDVAETTPQDELREATTERLKP